MSGFDPYLHSSSWPQFANNLCGEGVGFAKSSIDREDVTYLYREHPGRTLTLRQQEAIYSALVRVTTDSFGADMTEYWRSQYRCGYLERVALFMLAVDSKTSNIVGWSSAHVVDIDPGSRFVYLDSTGVCEKIQGKGIISAWLLGDEFSSLLDSSSKTTYVTARTESPVMHRVLSRVLREYSELYPTIDGVPPTAIQDVAASVAEWLGQRHLFDPLTLTVKGAYDSLSELYGTLPSSGDDQIDRLYRDGRLGSLDAYIVCGLI